MSDEICGTLSWPQTLATCVYLSNPDRHWGTKAGSNTRLCES